MDGTRRPPSWLLVALSTATLAACSSSGSSSGPTVAELPAEDAETHTREDTADSLSDSTADSGIDRTTLSIERAVDGVVVPPVGAEPSPDGRWMAVERSGSVCLQPLADQAEVCLEGGYPSKVHSVVWSPDASGVIVVADALNSFEPGPVVWLGVDGASRAIVGVPQDSQAPGVLGAVAGTFVGDRVLYVWASGDRRFELRSVRQDGSGDRLVRMLSDGGPDFFMPYRLIPSSGGAYAWVGQPGENLTAWFLADNGDPPVLVASPTRRTVGDVEGEVNWAPVNSSADFVVLEAVDLTGDFGRNRRLGDLVKLRAADGSSEATISDIAGYTPRSASVSPDGRWLAVYASYVGGDDSIRQSEHATVVGVVSTSSILDGVPEYSNLVPVGEHGMPRWISARSPLLRWVGRSQIMHAGVNGNVRFIELSQP